MNITKSLVILCGLALIAVGMLKIHTTQEHRHLWHQYEKALTQKMDYDTEWNKLKLEESMLITAVLMDKTIRDRLNMVLPKEESIVYVTEKKTATLVSAQNDKDRYIQ